MDDTILQNALTLEEGKWANWLASAERTRDQELRELAAKSAKMGLSGGTLRVGLKIIFDAIDGVVTEAIKLRATLAMENPSLADAANLTLLRSKIAEFINRGVDQVDNLVSKTFSNSPPEARKAILALASQGTRTLLTRVTNDLRNIPLELKLIPNKQAANPITIHVSGNANNVNLGTVLGDLNTSVQTLKGTDLKDIANVIATFGAEIQTSVELNDVARQEYLEHLATLSEQVVKPPDQRRIATFTSAISSLASIASVAIKLAPLYHQLIALLTQHHIIDR
jgi:hypothetical protein